MFVYYSFAVNSLFQSGSWWIQSLYQEYLVQDRKYTVTWTPVHHRVSSTHIYTQEINVFFGRWKENPAGIPRAWGAPYRWQFRCQNWFFRVIQGLLGILCGELYPLGASSRTAHLQGLFFSVCIPPVGALKWSLDFLLYIEIHTKKKGVPSTVLRTIKKYLFSLKVPNDEKEIILSFLIDLLMELFFLCYHDVEWSLWWENTYWDRM